MKCDVLVCGVGGQGVLSLAGLLSEAAVLEGFYAKQSEVHGMAQRGGAVVAHVRLSDRAIASDLIPRGRGDFVIGLEALEALRWAPFLGVGGRFVCSEHTVKNIAHYPDADEIVKKLRSYAGTVLVDSAELARRAGNAHAENAVMAGAASVYMPLAQRSFEGALEGIFGRKGARVLESVKEAFRFGRESALSQT